MRKLSTLLLLSALLVVGASSAVSTQAPATSPKPSTVPVATAEAPKPPPVPVRVDIMIQRSKGNTRISSMPYSIVTTTVNSAMLRLGSNVPVPNGQNSFNYQLVGTRIDTNMALTSDGRYNLYLSLDDSSVADTETGGATRSAMPILRSYAIETRLILRDGQSVEVNVGTDKVSGETVTALVMVTALKP